MHRHGHEALLGAVVEVVLNAPTFQVGSLHDPTLRRLHIGKAHETDGVQSGVLQREQSGWS
jgi:hypothetical protein